MGKALHVFANNQAANGNGQVAAVFGGVSALAANESIVATSFRQAGTFSQLGRRNLAGSGTNTWRLRVNAANVNEVASASGAGWVQDTVNTDTIVANDNINVQSTDDGTNPTYGVASILFEASGTHTCYMGIASAAVVYDVASSTRFIAFSGNQVADGTATESDAQLKNRGGTTLLSFQVRVSANARTNQSDFRTRINGADGAALISFAAGATGLVVSASSDALADGDLFNASITLGTGTEDLSVASVAVAQQNSSLSKNDLALTLTGSRTASATPNYWPLGGSQAMTTETTEGDVSLLPGYSATISNLRCNVTANTYTGSCTVRVFKNGSAALTLTITAGATGWIENTSDTLDFGPTDTLSYEIVDGTANSITIIRVMITLAEPVAVTGLGPLLGDWRNHIVGAGAVLH